MPAKPLIGPKLNFNAVRITRKKLQQEWVVRYLEKNPKLILNLDDEGIKFYRANGYITIHRLMNALGYDGAAVSGYITKGKGMTIHEAELYVSKLLRNDICPHKLATFIFDMRKGDRFGYAGQKIFKTAQRKLQESIGAN